MTEATSYLVTDIEANGLTPGVNSMLSIASVAVDDGGRELDRFVINLEPAKDTAPDPSAMEWWQTQPLAWAEATQDAVDTGAAISMFVSWARSLPGQRVFVANPLSFDGGYVAWYIQRYADLPLFDQPRRRGLTVCGLDLPTLVMGVRGWPIQQCTSSNYPSEWLGEHLHTHRAIDDALGYAHLLRGLLRDLEDRTSRPLP